MRVAKLARELAIIHNANPARAEIAALLHDCARFMDRAKLLARARELKLKILPSETKEPKLLHGRLGKIIAQKELGINDREILSAIENHTLGRPRMSTLEKIIFLADHAEVGRRYPEATSLRKLAKVNLNQALALSTACTLKYLKARGAPIDGRTKKTYRFYSKFLKG